MDMLSIKEAAGRLGVSLNTLRQWDKEGILKSQRRNGRSHRFYKLADIESFLSNADKFKLASKWVSKNKGLEPDSLFYCDLSSTFQARLVKMEESLARDSRLAGYFSVIVAAAGEIGNNSFDHNLGNWPDIPGIFFSYDLNSRTIVLADRGRGVLNTLRRVKPDLKDDTSALQVAFTEILSGRSPESRGNGLKLVRAITQSYPVSLVFQSGQAVATLTAGRKKIRIRKDRKKISGCLALIKF